MPSANSTTSKKATWIKWFRIFVAITVVVAVVFTAIKTTRQLKESEFEFSNLSPIWMLAAVLTYIVTMSFSWLFWHQALQSLGQKATPVKTLLAFFASQLGKYVPGKAMVVVIRTDMVRGENVKTAPAAASVFVETLTWLFVGAAIGCLLLVVQFREHRTLLISASVLTLLAGALTAPPVFQRIARRLGVAKGRNAEKILGGLNWKTMGVGWVLLTIGWCLNGLSLWMVIYGIGGSEVADQITIADFPLTLACVCLATVAGFVSLLPGGLGVRELVMIPLLSSRFGAVTAVVAAVLIRLVWLAAELLTSGIIYMWSLNKS